MRGSRNVLQLLLVATLMACVGCSELRARHHARKGNQHYLEGDYASALREYELADEIHRDLPVVLLNTGLACRQLMVPGAQTPANNRAVDCALRAFDRLKRARPDDARGDQLYVQTLFDADRFEKLAAMYEAQLQARPNDRAALSSLVQVYSRWERWPEALKWTLRRAELNPTEEEAQYAAGVFIYNLLFQKGGGVDKSNFDPRPEAKQPQLLPSWSAGDIAGAERVKLADQGIELLTKALALRPQHRDAMTYLNLLYRQKSFAFFDRPAEWQSWVDKAEEWRKKAQSADAEPRAPSSP